MNKKCIRCEKCGNELNEGAKFCAKCGSPVGDGSQNNVRHCAKCGNELNKGAMFCPKCGLSVNAVQTPSTVKKGIPKKLVGIVATAVVVLTAGIAIAAGSGDSGDKKSEPVQTHSSVKAEKVEEDMNDDDKANEPEGVNETGTHTISEYFKSENRVILYFMQEDDGKGSETSKPHSSYPGKDEVCNRVYVIENGKMSCYYASDYNGDSQNKNLLRFKELAKMTDDEIVQALKEKYTAKYEDRPITIGLFTDDTGNRIQSEAVGCEYVNGSQKDYHDQIDFLYASPQTTATVYDSTYTGLTSVAGNDYCYYWYRGNGLFLTLDGLDAEGVLIDP